MIADQSDVVVLIMRPLLYRIFSHLWRVIKGDNRHAEVTLRQDIIFTKTIIKRWRKKEDANLKEFTTNYSSKLVVLKSFAEIDRFFTTLKK